MKDIIKHSAGILGLVHWLNDLKSYGYSYEVRNNIIQISQTYNRTICMGKIKSGNTFIGFDNNFAKWARFIKWDRLVIDKEKSQIHLVSKAPENNSLDFSDFAITFYADMLDKLSLLEGNNEIDIRNYYINEGNIYIERYQKVSTLKTFIGSLELNFGGVNYQKQIVKEIKYETNAGELFKLKNGL